MDFWMIPEGKDITTPVRCGELHGRTVVSIIDVYRGLCEVDAKEAARIWRRMKDQFPLDTASIKMMKFPGRRQRETPVATERELFAVSMLPPHPRAVKVRARGVDGIMREIEERRGIEETKRAHPVKGTKMKLLRGPNRKHSMTKVKQLTGIVNEMVGCKNPQVYRDVFRPNMVAIKGMEPHTIAEIYEVHKNNVRDVLTEDENMWLAALETKQILALTRARNAGRTGKFVVIAVCNEVREKFLNDNREDLAGPVTSYQVSIIIQAYAEGEAEPRLLATKKVAVRSDELAARDVARSLWVAGRANYRSG